MKKIEFLVEGLYMPQRVDAYLAKKLEAEYSRSVLKKALDEKKFKVNGTIAKPKTLVHNNDVIEGQIQENIPYELKPEKIAIKILYQDADIAVLDKPAGMAVHPGAGNKNSTLVHALLGNKMKLSSIGEKTRPGIVHRLDKDTSGVLLIAKNNKAHVALQKQFEERSLSKQYLALVRGRVEFEEGHIDEPIGHHPKIRHKMAVSREETAKDAHTSYRVLQRFKHATFLEVKIMTGRTHQIRVHLAHLGYPVLGDTLYGQASSVYKRQALHASTIEFCHPKNGKLLKFESPLPKDFKEMLRHAEREN